jgi:hypothetical protein
MFKGNNIKTKHKHLIVCSLFTDAVVRLDPTGPNDWIMWTVRLQEQRLWPTFGYYIGTYLHGLRKNHDKPASILSVPRRDSIWVRSEQKTEALAFDPKCDGSQVKFLLPCGPHTFTTVQTPFCSKNVLVSTSNIIKVGRQFKQSMA